MRPGGIRVDSSLTGRVDRQQPAGVIRDPIGTSQPSKGLLRRCEIPGEPCVMTEEKHGSACHVVLSLILMVSGITLAMSSCAPPPSSGNVPTGNAADRPEWRIGDRWFHSWSAGIQKGIKVSESLGIREVGGVRYYVLRIEKADSYYTMDFHWAMQLQGSRVVARAVPPHPFFLWPLEVGKSWTYHGVFEQDRQVQPMRESFRVAGIERVDVPAGSFRAFKIVRSAGEAIVDEYWYAPEVRWYVKWIGMRGRDRFEEVLQDYLPAGPARSATTS